MSIKVMTLVWDVEFPGLAPKMVALKLADCASDRGDSIYPSVDTIERTTGCVQSTVRKWLFAMEHCGLLRVVKRSAGGAHKDTTVRAFDIELLRRLAPTVDAKGDDVPPELRLIEVRAKRLPQSDKDADPVVVDLDDERAGAIVTVFKIVPNAPLGQSDQGGPTPPLNGGVGNPTPPSDGAAQKQTPPPDGGLASAERTPPLRQADPTRPEPSRPVPLPPSPRKRGARERGDLVLEVRSAQPGCARAFDKLLAPLFARINLDAPNEVIALGHLAEFAEKQADEVLVEALKLLTEPGRHYRRFSAKAADVEDAIRTARNVVQTREAVLRPGPLIFRSSPEFAEAIAKVAQKNREYADSLRCNEYLRRSDLRAYGIPQVTP